MRPGGHFGSCTILWRQAVHSRLGYSKCFVHLPRRHAGGVLEQSWQDQLSELESRLARSAAEWKLVFGHHPIRTNNLKAGGCSARCALPAALACVGVGAAVPAVGIRAWVCSGCGGAS